MKKFIVLILTISMILSFSACGKTEGFLSADSDEIAEEAFDQELSADPEESEDLFFEDVNPDSVENQKGTEEIENPSEGVEPDGSAASESVPESADTPNPGAESTEQSFSSEQGVPEYTQTPEVSQGSDGTFVPQAESTVTVSTSGGTTGGHTSAVQPGQSAVNQNTGGAAAPAAPAVPAAPVQTPAPQEASLPYSRQSADTVLRITGSGVQRDWYFSMADIKSLGGVVSDSYFSRGKEPQEMTTHFTGISVDHLLSQIVGVSSYKKATFTAADGYAGSYSRSAIGSTYLNEKNPSAALRMILAWEEDGAPCSLRLVMGQQVAGEYNRTFWIRDVVTIEVKA